MEMTRRLWRDCHPVMHWEPSLAFCGSHTDERVTPWQCGVKDTGRAEGWGREREAGPRGAGLIPLSGPSLPGPPSSKQRAQSVPSVSLEGIQYYRGKARRFSGAFSLSISPRSPLNAPVT